MDLLKNYHQQKKDPQQNEVSSTDTEAALRCRLERGGVRK
jgi:hypothetical protein